MDTPPDLDPTRDRTTRYDREAVAYRDLWAPILQPAGLRLLQEVAGTRAARVLDVGAGVGTLGPHVQATFPEARVVGIDRSAGMLALAPAGSLRVRMDARQLAVPAASADVVLLVFMLFHLPQPLEGLREARRVLRPGGRVGSVTWGGDLDSRASVIWRECLDAHGAPPSDPATETRHEPVDTSRKMEGLLREAGFSSIRSWDEDLVVSIDQEHLIRLKTSLGSSKPRWDGLVPAARAACAEDARRRMTALAAADFVARGKVVYAVGTA